MKKWMVVGVAMVWIMPAHAQDAPATPEQPPAAPEQQAAPLETIPVTEQSPAKEEKPKSEAAEVST